jgi:hypothetical protein
MERKQVELFKVEIGGKAIEVKECTKCGQIKPLYDYYDRQNGKGGKHAECSECMKAAQAERRQSAALKGRVSLPVIDPTEYEFIIKITAAYKQKAEQLKAAEDRIESLLAERSELLWIKAKYNHIKESFEEWAQE